MRKRIMIQRRAGLLATDPSWSLVIENSLVIEGLVIGHFRGSLLASGFRRIRGPRFRLVFWIDDFDFGLFLETIEVGRHLVLKFLLKQGFLDVGRDLFEFDLFGRDLFQAF